MRVSLVSYTQPPQLMPYKPPIELVGYCARISNPSNRDADSSRLIDYLIKHKHWSPFEMVNVVLEIETTRDIARQLLRHRSFSFQEFSQRYAVVPEMSPPRECRMQDATNRQNSTPAEDRHLAEWWKGQQEEVLKLTQSIYENATARGIAKEQARAILPEGLTMSYLNVNGTLRSWIHYIELRSGNGTQKEHIELANTCAKVISEIFPIDKYRSNC